MNILVLEDDEDRIDWFEWWLQHHTVTFARTVEAAIQYHKDMDERAVGGTSGFDTYLLDHDLADEHYKDQTLTEGTGCEFAKFLAKDMPPGPSIIVHSMNIPGSKTMFDMLKKAGHNVSQAPFFVLQASQKAPYPA